jgi:anti-anti-sigma factor
MNINSYKYETDPSIAVLQLDGELDSSNYLAVIDAAKKSFQEGSRKLAIDLSKVTFMSSAGLMAVHTITLLFRGEESETGFRAIDPERDRTAQARVKLIAPQAQVDQVLDTVGLKRFFQIFPDLDTALKSF